MNPSRIDSLNDLSRRVHEQRRYDSLNLSFHLLSVHPLTTLYKLHQVLLPNGILTIDLLGEVPSDLDQSDAFSFLLSWCESFGLVPLDTPDSPSTPQALIFQKKRRSDGDGSPSLIIRDPLDHDEEACLELFERVFGEPPNQSLWRWKYGDGKSLSLLAESGHRLVAHYGGMSRPILAFGQKTKAVQICDVMVDPKERGILKRHGVFYHLAKAYQESIFGWRQDHLVGFGFPNTRHMKLGERLGIYVAVDSMLEYRWHPETSIASLFFTAHHVTQIDGFRNQVNGLWRLMAKDLTEHLVGLRDADYLIDRYGLHPTKNYLIFGIRSRISKALSSLVVLRMDGEVCRWVDYVGPLNQLSRAILVTRRIAKKLGAKSLLLWVTASQRRHFDAFSDEVSELDIHIPANTLVERIPPHEIQGRWWLMMGDTDFM